MMENTPYTLTADDLNCGEINANGSIAQSDNKIRIYTDFIPADSYTISVNPVSDTYQWIAYLWDETSFIGKSSFITGTQTNVLDYLNTLGVNTEVAGAQIRISMRYTATPNADLSSAIDEFAENVKITLAEKSSDSHMDFSTISQIVIPEGEVESIRIGEQTVWAKQKGRIPNEYQEVEYIGASSGYEYINTGMSLSMADGVEIDAVGKNIGGSEGYCLFGCAGLTSANTRVSTTYLNSNTVVYMGSVSAVAQTSQLSAGDKFRIVINASSNHQESAIYKEDGTEIVSNSANVTLTDQETYPMHLFAFKYNETTLRVGRGEIYSFKMSIGGEVKCDLVPCYRISDGEIGMYDTIRDIFLVNAGTNAFYKGADVTE